MGPIRGPETSVRIATHCVLAQTSAVLTISFFTLKEYWVSIGIVTCTYCLGTTISSILLQTLRVLAHWIFYFQWLFLALIWVPFLVAVRTYCLSIVFKCFSTFVIYKTSKISSIGPMACPLSFTWWAYFELLFAQQLDADQRWPKYSRLR